MTTGYQIKDIADRSGFSAATLRYYEEIGLLPTSSRTSAGYRLYDDDTLDRLAFIARAKQLGCTLDEIGDLTLAWNGGQCGPVQDRLRLVVHQKLRGAQQQVVELLTLTQQLRRAAASLELHRPDGPCDERCGCVTADSADREPIEQPVSVGHKPDAGDGMPIACTLSAPSLHSRLDEWHGLLTHVAHRQPTDSGVRLSFASTAPLHELIALAAAEHDCCRFFEFAITIDSRGIALEVSSSSEALPVVHALFGAPS